MNNKIRINKVWITLLFVCFGSVSFAGEIIVYPTNTKPIYAEYSYVDWGHTVIIPVTVVSDSPIYDFDYWGTFLYEEDRDNIPWPYDCYYYWKIKEVKSGNKYYTDLELYFDTEASWYDFDQVFQITISTTYNTEFTIPVTFQGNPMAGEEWEYAGRIPDIAAPLAYGTTYWLWCTEPRIVLSSYQWQYWTISGWRDIPNANEEKVEIEVPSEKTLFRRKCITMGGKELCSNVITMEVVLPYVFTPKGVNSIINHKFVKATKNFNDINPSIAKTSISYLDGFGRPIQNILLGGSPSGKDIVNFVKYDCMGRADSVSYLPFTYDISNRGVILNNPLSALQKYYTTEFPGNNDANYAFAQKQYDNSPLGLVLKQSGAGESQSLDPTKGHPVVFDYRKNLATDNIKKYEFSGTSALKLSGYYAAGDLMVRKTSISGSDPMQNKESYEYSDCTGQVIAKETRTADGQKLTTYYVYDDQNRLRYIVPPIQDQQMTSTREYILDELKRYCYYYEYENNGHIAKQYVPGAEPVFNLHDKRGRLAMSQDGNQRLLNQWTFTKFDELNRPIMTGLYTGGTFDSHKAALENQTVFFESRGMSVHGYTNVSYPITTANDILSVIYFDDYTWLSDNNHSFSNADALGKSHNTQITGLTAGRKTKVLGPATNQWLTSVIYYDNDYNTIQTISDLYPASKEIVSNKHDFTGNVIQAKVRNVNGSQVYEYNKWFEYDLWGRLKNIQQQITDDNYNGKVTLSAFRYNDLGAVTTKYIHNSADSINYTYNIAGTLISAVSKNFSYFMGYDRSYITGVASRYDGNVSHMTWRGSDNTERGYVYSYDNLGQMASANYWIKSGGTWSASGAYAEKDITYDKNGNILSLNRNNSAGNPLHKIEYKYNLANNGNALSSVKLSGVESMAFTYDRNGNMTYDPLNNTTFEYNNLNLPKRIFANNGEIKYFYSADGQKLGTQANNASWTLYQGPMVFADANATQLLYILQPEGVVVKESSGFVYKYFLTDHIGSTRVVLAATKSNGSTTLNAVQKTDYYPFGLAHENNNLNQNKYLFGGKEFQDAAVGSSGILGLYDFHARYYNPVVGKWFNIDPALQGLNPYIYCGNSPATNVDPTGLAWGASSNRLTWFSDPGIVDQGTLDNYLIKHPYWGSEKFTYLGKSGYFMDPTDFQIYTCYDNGTRLNGFKARFVDKDPFEYFKYELSKEDNEEFQTRLLVENMLQTQPDFMNRLQRSTTAKTESSLAERMEKLNEVIKSVNDPADLAIAIAIEQNFSSYEIKWLKQAGYLTKNIGYLTGITEGVLTYMKYKNGEPWVNSAVDTGISVIGWAGLQGAAASFVLSTSKQALFYINDAVNQINNQVPGMIMNKITMFR